MQVCDQLCATFFPKTKRSSHNQHYTYLYLTWNQNSLLPYQVLAYTKQFNDILRAWVPQCIQQNFMPGKRGTWFLLRTVLWQTMDKLFGRIRPRHDETHSILNACAKFTDKRRHAVPAYDGSSVWAIIRYASIVCKNTWHDWFFIFRQSPQRCMFPLLRWCCWCVLYRYRHRIKEFLMVCRYVPCHTFRVNFTCDFLS